MKIQFALRANAAFSFVSGALFISLRNSLGQFIGYENDLLYIILGIGLICFSIFLAVVAGRQEIKRTVVKAIVYMDLAWVFGSVILVITPTPILMSGKLLISLIAGIVMIMAILQNIGAKHLK